MTVAATDGILEWHDLPLSSRREIAAMLGVPPSGAIPRHFWTMRIIDAARERRELELLKAAILAAANGERDRG